MPLDQKLIDDVLAHADIVRIISSYINLTKKGANYWGLCPFHDDNNPSLSVSPEKHIFTCWVCHTSGSAITFVQKIEHISFFEALKKVADMSDYHDPRLEGMVRTKPVDEKKAPLLKCLSDLTLYYQYALNTAEGKEGLDYFEKRHIDAATRAKYKLGYAYKNGKVTCDFLQSKGHSLKTIEDVGVGLFSGNTCIDRYQGRVIFPICDADGNVVGYSARRIGDGPEAKYVNTGDTYLFKKSKLLYNYHIAKERARTVGYIYICEGFMDVFALAKIGIDSAVAVMGTKLTAEHIALLRMLNVEIRMCLDGDLPGQEATMEYSKALYKAGLSIRIVDNQNNSRDPDEIYNQDGPDALKAYVNNLISRVDFALNYFKNSNPLTTMEQKKALVKQFIPILLGAKDQLELDSYLRRLSAVTGFEPESIRDLLKTAKNSEEYSNPMEAIATFHPERKALRRLELAERELLYQMLNNPEAVEFYEQRVGTFYDDVYRQVANYIVDYAKMTDDVNAISVLSSIEMSELENKQELINELANLSLEDTHNKNCSKELLENLLASIDEEKEKIFEKDMLEQSLKNKDPLEKARIMAEYNRRKMKKANKKEGNGNG